MFSYTYFVWLFSLMLEWTLNYYSNQSIAKFFLSKPELWYLTCEATKFNKYDGFILLILGEKIQLNQT